MNSALKNWKQTCADLAPGSDLTCGIVFVIVLSCFFSVIPYCLDSPEHIFSLESSAVISGHVYQLITYFLYHKNIGDFLLGALLMVFPCRGLEKGVGSVRFLHRTLLLSFITGLLYVLLESLLISPSSRSSVNGLVPLALSVLGVMTINSGMKVAYIMGINVPTPSLPWIFLIIITLFVPNTVFMCNVLAILTGISYGMGWFSLLDMSESTASVLEKKIPFRLMKHIPGVQFIPSSTEERKKPLDLSDAPPGSYPVQTYSLVNVTNGQVVGNLPNTFNGWPVSLHPQQKRTFPSAHAGAHNHGHTHGHCHRHSHGHHHGHSHHNTGSPFMPMSPYAHPPFRPPVNMTGQNLSQLPQPGVQFTPHIPPPAFPTATATSESLSS